jgi:hypothetical protein
VVMPDGSVARTRTSAIGIPRLFLGAGGFEAHFRARNDFVGQRYGKVAIACQADIKLRTAAKRCSLLPDRVRLTP